MHGHAGVAEVVGQRLERAVDFRGVHAGADSELLDLGEVRVGVAVEVL
ncbi:hypothetical protein [Pseudonocardia sp. KRD291]|nr:hypothetical protein [Pseudonocardia sp. KRD291]